MPLYTAVICLYLRFFFFKKSLLSLRSSEFLGFWAKVYLQGWPMYLISPGTGPLLFNPKINMYHYMIWLFKKMLSSPKWKTKLSLRTSHFRPWKARYCLALHLCHARYADPQGSALGSRFVTLFTTSADPGIDLKTLRAIRVLRPLKLVSGIPSE